MSVSFTMKFCKRIKVLEAPLKTPHIEPKCKILEHFKSKFSSSLYADNTGMLIGRYLVHMLIILVWVTVSKQVLQKRKIIVLRTMSAWNRRSLQLES